MDNTKTLRILCFGDSNTWGYNPADSTRLPGRWTRQLEWKGEETLEVVEEGLNSRNAVALDEYAPEKCGIHSFKMMLQSHKPLDAVVLMLGTNDLKSHYCNTANNIANGIREYVRLMFNPTLFEGTTTPKLLVVSPIHLGDTLPELQGEGGGFDERSVRQSHLLAEWIENTIAPYMKDGQVFFMDASKYAKPSAIDGLHMDADNHARLAHAISKKLGSMLG